MNFARYFKLSTQASFLPLGFSSYRAQHINGNTIITAGNHYQQTGSTVASPEGKVYIQGKSVDIEAAYDTSTYDNVTKSKQSGLTVAINIPVVSAIQAVAGAAGTIGKSKNDRVNAMAVANTAWDAKEAAKEIKNAATAIKGLANGGSLKDAATALNISASVTVGSQKSTQTSHSESSTAVASSVTGQSVSVVATGAGAESNIRIVGSDVGGTQSTYLKADNQVIIESAQSTVLDASSNKSSGWNAGIVASTQGIGITAGGNLGKGRSNGEGVSQRNSRVGTAGSLTTVESGGTTTLAGGQLIGNRVELDAAELNIESRQDTSTYSSKQRDMSGQLTVGVGVSVSGSYSKSNVNADYASVNEQSGIMAGDGGYTVNVKGNTALNGGGITSTQAAEDAGLNSFSTGTLTSRDIQNHADYEGSSFGISAGAGFNNAAANNPNSIWAPQGSTAVNPKTGALNTGRASTTVNKSIGWGSDDGHEQSTTASGINTANLTITNESGQTATGKSVEQIKAEVATDTTTDTVALNSGAIGNNFDAAAVQSELDLQVKVTQAFDKNRQAAKASINKAVDDLKKEKDDPKTTAARKAEIDQSIGQWQTGGVVLDAIAGGLSAPTNSIGGIAANTLAPAASYQIGQYFKDLADNNANGKLTAGQTAAHILAHTILGAATAAAGGNNALVGGLSAGGAEAAAPAVAHYLYGDVKPSDLTAEQKSTISAIVGLGGSAVGVTTGSVGDIASGGALAQNAVENNHLSPQNVSKYLDAALACSSSHGQFGCDSKEALLAQAQRNKDRLRQLRDKDKRGEAFSEEEIAFIKQMYQYDRAIGSYFENAVSAAERSGVSYSDAQALETAMLDHSQVSVRGLYIDAMQQANGLSGLAEAGGQIMMENGVSVGNSRGLGKVTKVKPTNSGVALADGAPPRFANTLSENPSQIWGLTPQEIAKGFQAAGYKVNVRSGKGRSDSTVIEVTGHPQITQVQVTNNSVSHKTDYYKISTSTVGKYKVVGPNYTQRGSAPERNTSIIQGR